MLDTISKSMTYHLEAPVGNLSISTDSINGATTYQLTLEKEKTDSQSIVIWEGLFFGLLIVVFAAVFWLWLRKKSSKNQLITADENQENALRNALLRQSEAYKAFVRKGYFAVNRKTVLETVKEQEINALCDAVVSVYAPFSEWLHEKGLSEKDFQFCCLLKSGLSTFELAEIYCVSESAIFKRKQKLKEKLGFGIDGRTLDAIIQDNSV